MDFITEIMLKSHIFNQKISVVDLFAFTAQKKKNCGG